MFYEFLQPLDREKVFGDTTWRTAQLGSSIDFYEGKTMDIDGYDLAILSVSENRGHAANRGVEDGHVNIRRELYRLYTPVAEKPVRIVDLGEIKTGATLKDTYFGLAAVMLQLLTSKVIPIIIGGTHDMTFGQYLGYQELYTLINMVIIDERIDMEEPNGEMDASSYLMPILSHSPNYLFNYSHLGYQTYLNDPKTVDMLESLNFDCLRLGMVRQHISEVEPILRDADMLSIDISSIRMADAPGHVSASPNGFNGEELCQITRYAGLSDKLTSISISEYNPHYDNHGQTAQLIAQMLWYFVEGYYSRKGDMPANMDQFLKFTVKFEQYDHELIFWKSKVTERWWMELPYGDRKKYARHQMVPCSYTDYEMACKDELPDRWMKVYNKLMDA
ncbi:MAG: formimidoylglutamase [Bacteroidetes bacterium]|nr:formimidoylglutamase [Bacteroidota bacterium]